MQKTMSNIEFLNIDLDIESNDNIQLLVEELGKRLTVMNNNEIKKVHYASFETSYSEENEIINEYVSIISALSSDSKSLWNNCIKRVFNIGYESGKEPSSYESRINENSVKALAEINGSIYITIYPETYESA